VLASTATGSSTSTCKESPSRAVDFSNASEKTRYDKITELVGRMLGLNKKKHSGRLAPSELERVERDIVATDAEIDDLVYELYGMTDEERRIIEGEGSTRFERGARAG
jgi:hypothetical protein